MFLENYKIKENSIILTREDLEAERMKYLEIAKKYESEKPESQRDFNYGFYTGQAEVLYNIRELIDYHYRHPNQYNHNLSSDKGKRKELSLIKRLIQMINKRTKRCREQN